MERDHFEKIALFCNVDADCRHRGAGRQAEHLRDPAHAPPAEAGRPDLPQARPEELPTRTWTHGAACCACWTSPSTTRDVAVVGKYIGTDSPPTRVIDAALEHGGMRQPRARAASTGWSRDASRSRARRPPGRGQRHAGRPAASAPRHRGQDQRPSSTPARTASPSSASAWACSAPSSSSPATCCGLDKANTTEVDPDTPDP